MWTIAENEWFFPYCPPSGDQMSVEMHEKDLLLQRARTGSTQWEKSGELNLALFNSDTSGSEV